MPSVIDVRALRRRPLYPTELRGLIQKIFNFAELQDSNDSIFRRQSLYPTELYGPIVLKPAISRGLTPYIVFFGLDNILSEEGIIHGLLLSIYCRVGSHFSRRFELTTELQFFSRLVLALFLRRRMLYPLSYWGL